MNESKTVVIVVENYKKGQPIDETMENVRFFDNDVENLILATNNNKTNEKGLYQSKVITRGHYEALARMLLIVSKNMYDTFVKVIDDE